MLPASKQVPKEMLPVVDRPAIQWVIEELVASGIEQVILVTGRGKVAIEDHFDHAYELEDQLERKGKTDMLREVRRIATMVDCISVRQKRPLGLGHAVLCARNAVGQEPFAVALPDDLFIAERPVTGQLVRVFEEHGTGTVGLIRVPREATAKYGVISGEKAGERLYQIESLVEKPAPEDAPSQLAVPGRYVLPAHIFELLAETEPGVGGEIQLTDALAQLAREAGMMGWEIEGERHDVGNQLGYLRATVVYALRDEKLGPDFRAFLEEVV
jgi:UTP--glucose-1-phosphate uridylyltransferase